MGSLVEAEPAVLSAPSEPSKPREPTTFMSLPAETQKEIFNHCAQCDLICLSLVSRHFRELAAAQLYRNFHIVFPDEDDPTFDSPIDGLAGGLDTFVTSDYKYAKHLRDFSLDTLSSGDKAEAAYKNYLYSSSCGKFLNSLLFLTLKEATSLEAFHWNIRVELSRPVYKVLHSIETLRDLHIRMQAGESLFSIPPSLPYHYHQQPLVPSWTGPDVAQPAAPIPAPPPIPLGLPPPPVSAPGVSVPSGFMPAANSITNSYIPSIPPPPGPPPPRYDRSSAKTSKMQLPEPPPTLSGFKNLKSLAILDIDSLDILEELTECVQNSTGTLTKLKLSFSDLLASSARKPAPDSDSSNDSDEDEEFQPGPMQGNQHIPDDMTGPARAFRAGQMRKRQEGVLGEIFEIVDPKKSSDDSKDEEDSDSPKDARAERDQEKEMEESEDSSEGANPDQTYLKSIREVSEKLMAKLGKDEQEELLDTIIKASKRYVDSVKKTAAVVKKEPEEPRQDGSEGDEVRPIEAAADTCSTESAEGMPAAETSRKQAAKDPVAEDINVEEPLEDLSLEAGIDEKDHDPECAENDKADGASPVQAESTHSGSDTAVAQSECSHGSRTPQHDNQRPLRTVKKNIQEAKEELEGSRSQDGQAPRDTMAEYVRSTRGIGLKTLGIHQIPIKAAVLTKALDFRAMKRITLLNVGNQAPLWAALTKLNRIEPLPLSKIFTDNVSQQFLTLVSQLKEVHELFMLERPNKFKPEILAPKTTVKIADIRKHILKPQLPHLKRLMIKNEADPDHESHHDSSRSLCWDVDEKTMLLICRKGKALQELSISAGIRSIHTMVQHISDLVNLKALHIQKFRNEDTCVWVMRETRRFVRDNLTHYPHLKLEWLCIDDDRVDRILRHPPEEGKPRGEKNKEKAGGSNNNNNNSVFSPAVPSAYPLLSAANLSEGDDSGSEPDNDRDIQDMKLELMESVQFYDIWGVRIFKKEVMAGRL